MTTRIVLIAALLALTGCASSPRYVAADSASDHGYYTRQISENRYRVNYNGSRRTGLQDTRDYALLRAAEITLAHNYEWFEVVDREAATTAAREPHAEVGFGYERAYYTERNCGLLGCSQRTRPVTYSTWSIDSHSHHAETRHSYSLEILMGKGKMPQDGRYYDAEQVKKSLAHTM